MFIEKMILDIFCGFTIVVGIIKIIRELYVRNRYYWLVYSITLLIVMISYLFVFFQYYTDEIDKFFISTLIYLIFIGVHFYFDSMGKRKKQALFDQYDAWVANLQIEEQWYYKKIKYSDRQPEDIQQFSLRIEKENKKKQAWNQHVSFYKYKNI